jgi:deoxyribose-phosphate aldolase
VNTTLSGRSEEERLRSAIEATRLGFGITVETVSRLVESAASRRVQGICLPIAFVPAAVAAIDAHSGWAPDVVTVVNFPTADWALQMVLDQTRAGVEAGANHVDMVVPGEMVMNREWKAVAEFVAEVKAVAAGHPKPALLKVILETAALNEELIRGAAEASIEGGADWLKSSTGFHPAGGATPEVISLLRSIAPAHVGVKASGGVRTREQAVAMLEAGADRIGTSAESTILAAVE